MRSEFFQALLRSLQDGVVVIDERGTIELINPGLERLLGYTEAELKGRNVSLLMPLHHGARHNDCIQHYLTTGEARIIGKDIPLQALHKDRSLVDVMLSVTEVTQDGQRYFVGRLRDIRPQLQQERELQHLANHDPITGLRNGAALRKTLTKTSNRQTTNLGALAIVDIERFRIINDTAGHRVGDWLLQQIAQRLVIHAPVNAGVFRWTGDEFVLLLPSAPLLEPTHRVFEKWIRQVSEREFVIGSHRISVRLRGGCRICPIPCENADEELALADMALIQAKRRGFGTVIDYAQLQHLRDWTVLQLNRDLQRALENEEFKLYLQPQVDDNRNIIGAEGLLRWEHPTRGLLSPGAFLAAAQEIGLLNALGMVALEKAVSLALEWENDPLLGRLTLSANLSPQQFRCPDLIDHLRRCIGDRELPGNRLQLEITEDAVFDDEQGVQRTLSELQALGFGISLDDFGTGHSSLKRLMALPFCEIKIDRTFVAGLETEPRALPILDAILSVGRALGVECVAEGVEQPHQFEALQHLGCHRFQGFLFSHAVPVDAFVALVRAQRPLPTNTRVKPA